MYVALIGKKKLELKAKVMLVVGRKKKIYSFLLVIKFDNLLVEEEVEENPLCSCFLFKASAITSELPF